MGREIRRVPPNWEHPKKPDRATGKMEYVSMYDEDYETASAEWKQGYAKWESGLRPTYDYDDDGNVVWVPLADWHAQDIYDADMQYWEYCSPPGEREMYRPKWSEDEATWFQVYQTVSEGTPVSPPFATQEELVDYLVKYGDFWCQSRGERPPSRKAAEAFVSGGHVPSMMVIRNPDGSATIKEGIECAAKE